MIVVGSWRKICMYDTWVREWNVPTNTQGAPPKLEKSGSTDKKSASIDHRDIFVVQLSFGRITTVKRVKR